MTSRSHDAPLVLGLAASHNGAAALLRGTHLLGALQEERICRTKRAPLTLDGPLLAADALLAAHRATAADVDLVALCPLRDAAAHAARLARHPTLGQRPCAIVPHHRAHAAAAWAQSGAETATILVIDGAGSLVADLPPDERGLVPEAPDTARETISIYHGTAGRLVPLHKQTDHQPQTASPADQAAIRPILVSSRFATAPAPDLPPEVMARLDLMPRMMPFTSLGVMYQAVAQQIFGQWDAAGKVMGLAPCGSAALPVEHFLSVEADARIVFHDNVHQAFRTRERWPDHAEVYADLAASVQRALEVALLALVEHAWRLAPAPVLAYAGGVALNSVANTLIASRAPFDRLFVMPAAEDNGTAIGAALLGLGPISTIPLEHDALGLAWDAADIDRAIDSLSPDERARFTVQHTEAPCRTTARLLAAGRIVGWLQGRSEFGPRALGQRSILLDPRRPDGKDLLNARVKHREAFRPFAPAILEEHVADWFDLPPRVEPVSPFMLHVWPFRPERRPEVPAVVHVDGTGRVQTLGRANGRFRQLVEAFYAETGVPMVLNTSFNDAGEPIVESPTDALRCFLATGLEILVLEDRVLTKRPAP